MQTDSGGKPVYCISGLGADERIFEGFHFPGFTLQYLSWLPPLRNEKIDRYAERIRHRIEDPEPILFGVSFGGILAIEIAKKQKVQKLVLVSAVKTAGEMPSWMRMSGYLHLHKILPVRSVKITERFDNRRLGIRTKEEEMLVNEYRKEADHHFIEWGIHEILTWKNDVVPGNCIHIHGSEDRVFPIRNIQATHIVPGGTHIMVLNRKTDLGKIITEELSGK